MSTEQTTPKNINKIIWVLFVFFLSLLAFLIWWFEFRWMGTFEERAVSFIGSDNTPNVSALFKNKKKPLVIHFFDPACECNRFSEPHINHISIYALRHTQNLVAYSQAPEKPTLLLHKLEDINILKEINNWVPATPAVGIWDTDGQLAYFGPYSSGAICGRGDDLVQYVLDEFEKGNNPRWINQEAVGCYCPWPKQIRETMVISEQRTH